MKSEKEMEGWGGERETAEVWRVGAEKERDGGVRWKRDWDGGRRVEGVEMGVK